MIFNSFHDWVEFGTILEGLRNFREGGSLNPSKPPLGTPLASANVKVKTGWSFISVFPLCLNGLHSDNCISKKKNHACFIFCIFYLSSPLHCTVVSFERGAGFWEVRMGSFWGVAREG